jgi:hypothetical protein
VEDLGVWAADTKMIDQSIIVRTLRRVGVLALFDAVVSYGFGVILD